jgi:riboflavin synthase
MFTGLIQSLGTIRRAEDDVQGGRTLWIGGAGLPTKPQVGDSVAVNGTCLTVSGCEGNDLSFQAGAETLARTNLGQLAAGDRVNLEPALRAGDPIGGHFVAGHIDSTGTILERSQDGEWLTVWLGYPPQFGDLLVSKGSVAVDGVSLTVVEVKKDRFSVMVIPHTRDHTTLGFKESGASVNLEFDLIAKHVKKLVQNVTITI